MSDAPDSPFGIDRLFETAKWLVGIFGAVAGVLVAAVPFSKFGELDAGSDAFGLAALGIGLAFVGAMVVVGFAAYALTGGFVDLAKVKDGGQMMTGYRRLKNFLTKDRPDILKDAGHQDLDAMWAAYTSSDDEKRADARSTMKGLMPMLAYLQVRRRLRIAVAAAFVGVAVAGVGGAMFAWNVTRPAPPTIDPPAGQPVAAVLRLTDDGREVVTAKRGEDVACSGPELDVLLLASADDVDDVLLPATRGCEAMRLRVTTAVGTVEDPPASVAD